ncbi:carbohydrate porin [Phormidium tenue FACHB-886]|nr:carbohydrate porin [Phormidium tenue FACHB-886]
MKVGYWLFTGSISILWFGLQNSTAIASSTQAVTAERTESINTVNTPISSEGTPISNSSETGMASDEVVDTSAIGQVTSVNQLSDVQPTDWAFQALQSLVERYGCIAGYPYGSFRGDRALTRYEFAAGLNTCLDRINELISSSIEGFALSEDLGTLQRLQEEFASELITLQGRVDTLEARTAELEANQFSTTTRLTGQAIFAANGGGFEGDAIADPTEAVVATDDPNITALYRVALDLNTSFTGTDLLKIRIDTGINGGNDNAAGVLEPNFGSVLDFSVKPPSDGTFGLGRFYYTFTPLQDLSISLGPNIRTTDYIDLNSYANLSFRDFSTQALVNNYILFPINGPSAGASVVWNPGEGDFTLRALYAAADAANPGNRGILRGTAAFTGLLYPANGNPATVDRGDRGLFGDTYQGMIELEYSPSANFALRLQYSGGEVFDNRFDGFGANAELTLTQTIGIFGRYGDSSYADTVFGDLNPSYWMAGLAARDLLTQGSLAGIAVVQPFIEEDIGDATQTNFEAFYNFPINDSIRITPLIQVVTNSSNQADNGTIITGTLRTVFLF